MTSNEFQYKQQAVNVVRHLKPSMIRFCLIILIVVIGCSTIRNTSLLEYAPPEFRLESTLLKSDGYYYGEREMTRYCRRRLRGSTSGTINDTTSAFSEKYISVFALYKDGYAFFSGNHIISGVTRLYMKDNYCDSVSFYNTFAFARQQVEYYLQNGLLGIPALKDKGIFKIYNDTIKFQIYHGEERLFLNKYEGKILNDSTFKIFRRSIYYSSKPEVKDFDVTFHFKKFDVKPDSVNRLRTTRRLDK